MRVFVFIGVIAAACLLALGIFSSSAMHQTAFSAMSCAVALIPYILFRLQAAATAEDQRKELIDLLRQRE